MSKHKDVAVVVQTVVQFFNIKNGIDELLKNKITCDIFVPYYDDNEGYKDIYDETYRKICQMGYTVKRKTDDTKYKILLEAYPIDDIILPKHKYRLKYLYSSTVGVKPNLSLKPDFLLKFDGIFVYNMEEKEYLSAFCKTFLIGNLKFKNFKKKNAKGKTILYLPTYGDSSDIDYTVDLIKKLKGKYKVYIKAHHGTDFLNNEKERLNKIKQSCDKFYNSSENLIDILSEVDLVISDNSGAIFDSLYAEVPVVIFSKDINRNKINDDFNTEQYELVEKGIIPFTDNPDDIEKLVEKGFESGTLKRQLKYKYDEFYCPKDNVKDFIEIINDFLNDNINKKYKILHDRILKYCDNLTQENIKIINNYNVLNEAYNNTIKEMENYKKKVEYLENNNKLLDNRFNRIYIKIRSKFGGKNE